MAFGRGRGNKRSSSTSCTSSITMFVFVSVCVIGVWMLSSNSILPSRHPISRASTSHEHHHVKLPHHSIKSHHLSNHIKIISSMPGDDDDDDDDDDTGKLTHLSQETTISQAQEAQEIQETQETHETQETQETQESLETQDTQETQERQDTQDTQKIEQKEEKEQRYEDAETQSKLGTQEQDHGTGKDSQDVTFTDATKEEQNIEHGFIKDVGQSGTSDNPKTEQKQEDDNNSANQENAREEEDNKVKDETRQQQEEDKNTTNEENGNELNTTDDNETGNKEEQSTTEDNETGNNEQQSTTEDSESGNKEEQNTTEDNETGNTEEQSTTEDNERDNKEEQNTTEDSESGSKEEQSTTKEQQEEVQEVVQEAGLGSGIPKESAESHKSWKSQATESNLEKQRQTAESNNVESMMGGKTWVLCNTTTGADYIPCLDNEEAIKKLRSRRHFEHRERHCPEDPPTCLVPLPQGYKESIKWPESRDKIWYHNVPHTLLAEVKGHQNWVKVTGEFLTFPGGGTQFIHGALHYIDFLQKSLKQIRWGKHTRVLLDVGCGVASFGGYLFERDVLAMSFAPKDEHVAQVQFALERKIPAISAVMGSTRLPYPSRVFDLIHCARCRVPWHNEGGLLLLELNRVLRPGGYFVWSATPVYQKLEEDVEIWRAMSSLTKSMCWELVTINKDRLNGVGAAIYRKPTTNECYEKRKENEPPMCQDDDDANAAWYVPLRACMHKVPTNLVERGSKWPVEWPRRLQTPPYWLNSSQMGIYGKPAPRDFTTDYEHWKQVVSKVYMNEIGISWSNVRNVMDMRAVYGGFAAALKDLQVWVMNVVNINSPDTLPIIFERGLFGIYHDWCESFSTYPRSYDLLHADHLFSKLKARCNLVPVMAEVDRIVRPGGKFIVRDESNVIREVENMLKSMHWDVHLTFSKNQEGLLSAQKGFWRPDTARIEQEKFDEMK